MRDLDSQETYLADSTGVAFELRDLVGSGPNPSSSYAAPYGVVGFGEGWWPALLAREWIPAEITTRGTQFVLEGGYDFGHAQGAGFYAEASGAEIVRLGLSEHAEVPFPPSPLSPYRYLRFLLLATGQQEELARIDQALLAERELSRSEVPMDHNPAKFLAYTLLERTPVWVVPAHFAGLAGAMQQTFSRVAKSLSIAPPSATLEFLVTGLEARHEQGDPLAGVIIGNHTESKIAHEIMESRVDTLVEIPRLEAEGRLAETMSYWYRVAWASYYLALLYGVEPGDSEVLSRLRAAT